MPKAGFAAHIGPNLFYPAWSTVGAVAAPTRCAAPIALAVQPMSTTAPARTPRSIPRVELEKRVRAGLKDLNTGKAAEAIRLLIERIVLGPGLRRGGIEARLCGAQNANTPGTLVLGVLVLMVAGIGFEPMTFRL
jgi:hypothetical protein